MKDFIVIIVVGAQIGNNIANALLFFSMEKQFAAGYELILGVLAAVAMSHITRVIGKEE